MIQNLIVLQNAKVEVIKKSFLLKAWHKEAVYTFEAGGTEKTKKPLSESTSSEPTHF